MCDAGSGAEQWVGTKKTDIESYKDGGPYAVAKHLIKLLSAFHTSLFIHSPVGGCLSCFQFMIITNKDGTNMLSLFLGKYLGVKWLDHMEAACLNVKETNKLFSEVVMPFWILTSRE